MRTGFSVAMGSGGCSSGHKTGLVMIVLDVTSAQTPITAALSLSALTCFARTIPVIGGKRCPLAVLPTPATATSPTSASTAATALSIDVAVTTRWTVS